MLRYVTLRYVMLGTQEEQLKFGWMITRNITTPQCRMQRTPPMESKSPLCQMCLCIRDYNTVREQ